MKSKNAYKANHQEVMDSYYLFYYISRVHGLGSPDLSFPVTIITFIFT